MVSETELRDQLALDRTQLANERTFLAYIRTGLALFVAGAGMLGFFDVAPARISGWILLGLGAVTLPLGLWRFLRIRQHISAREASGPLA